MLFTWSTENLCIVFPQWRVTGLWSVLTSLLAVVAITAGYEAVRAAARRYESRETSRAEQMGSKSVLYPDE
jgi:solute carrier family 31 (copper transporter), member 1